jgi:hypothetical protein
LKLVRKIDGDVVSAAKGTFYLIRTPASPGLQLVLAGFLPRNCRILHSKEYFGELTITEHFIRYPLCDNAALTLKFL